MSHGFLSSSLVLSENLYASLSMFSTTDSISWPLVKSSEGCFTFFHERSDIWTSPSMPSSTPTKIPKSVMFFTTPFILLPGGYFDARASHGFGSTCLSPKESLFASVSMSSTTTSIWSPTLTFCEG